jgi:hypothetical protein
MALLDNKAGSKNRAKNLAQKRRFWTVYPCPSFVRSNRSRGLLAVLIENGMGMMEGTDEAQNMRKN